jgi:hypothetical protein
MLLERHIEAFRNIGAEAGGDDDAAAEFLRGGVADPDRIAAGAEERIGVGRLGLGGIELVMRVGLEDARLFGAAAVGLDVDDFLVVAGQRQAHLAPEIFRGLDVEEVGVGFAGRGTEFSGAQAAAAGNSLVVAEPEIVGMGHGERRHQQQRDAQTDFHDVVHPNHPYQSFSEIGLERNRNIVAKRHAGNHKVAGQA